MGKIVLNLISNAFKYTFEGTISVGFEKFSDDPEIILTVSDTGIGIAPDELPHLFERFHRVEGAHGRTDEGTGIGLALVQELVKLHGGTISVESEQGKGSIFTVRLPLGAAHLPRERIQAGPFQASSLPHKADAYVEEARVWLPDVSAQLPVESFVDKNETTNNGHKAKGDILLADDNADMREYVSRLLAPHYRVTAVSNGREALAAALRNLPDLVLSDVMMPHLDGFGLLKALRSNPQTSTLPVILLSARAGEESKVEGLEAGADDYLVKPFTARELVARVATHMEMSQARRTATERGGAARAGRGIARANNQNSRQHHRRLR